LGAAAVQADPVAGSTGGTFINPTPPSATTTGVGTSTFSWGVGQPPPPNSLTYTGTSFSSVTDGTPFKVGSLNYYNGTVAGGTEADSVDLKIALTFTTPAALGTQNFTFTLNLDNTPNTGDPIASADYVIFPTNFAPQTFTIGSTQYTLKITGFENVVGDGFLPSSDAGFHVEENESASADIFAEVTSDFSGSPFVPEPASLSVLGMGAAGLLLRRRRKTA
jgi:hypothetical protein